MTKCRVTILRGRFLLKASGQEGRKIRKRENNMLSLPATEFIMLEQLNNFQLLGLKKWKLSS